MNENLKSQLRTANIMWWYFFSFIIFSIIILIFVYFVNGELTNNSVVVFLMFFIYNMGFCIMTYIKIQFIELKMWVEEQ